MMNILETERLYLREFSIADAENIYLLNLDPDVIKYTGDNAFESVEHAKVFLESYDHYRKYGFGRWGVINKADDDFLGWCGLKFIAEANEYDLGFRFFKRHWNKGYATEAAKACVQLGFTKFKIPEITGNVLKANIGSIKVLEKTGLHFLKLSHFHGEEGLVYKIAGGS